MEYLKRILDWIDRYERINKKRSEYYHNRRLLAKTHNLDYLEESDRVKKEYNKLKFSWMEEL